MANITGATDERVFSIQRWLGLNENPDGDTKLKMGEAADMRNFRVTRDGNLQKRPGVKDLIEVVSGKAVDAVWTGLVNGKERVMAVCNGKLYSMWDYATSAWAKTEIGSLGTVTHVCMFGFSDKLYIITGAKYFCYDGTTLGEVEGYAPLVAISIPPAGGGELLEGVNKLTAKRRAWFSPDGTAVTFQLPEKGLASIDKVVLTADGTTELEIASSSTADGTVTLSAAPAAGTNTVEVQYTAAADFRSQITAMHFAEFYSGTQDTRVFLYGDGSNEALYSDITYDGQQSAEYFPDLNEIRVGQENTPITAMVRHYGSLAAYKSDSTYSINYGTIMLADGNETAAFYLSPVNRAIGNEAPGQVQLVLNSPISLFGQDVYEWKNGNYRGTALNRDERVAQRISDRVYDTLHQFDTKECITFDNNYEQEYYICDEETNRSLVWNYAADAWTVYTHFSMHRPFAFRNELYYGAQDGYIYHVSTIYKGDATAEEDEIAPIFCHWRSGSMSMGADYRRKNSAMLWVGLKPEGKAAVDVTVYTDKDREYAKKNISFEQLFDFGAVDFEHFTFNTNYRPQMKRLKIKAKKFVYYMLVFESNTNDTSCTVTAADIRVRVMGYAKG